jgi:hypothetical protein
MKRVLIVSWGLVCLVSLGAQAEDEPAEAKAEAAAVAAAESWLALVDNDQYAESWDAAAGYLQRAVGKDDFVKALAAARTPLGKVLSRKLKSKEYRTSLPGAPDGQYVVLQFETSLANKKSAVETVTPMLDKNNTWRISGYFIR